MKSRRAAFTLVEVLVALVLLAALLAAVNQFVFSVMEAWTRDQERFVFAQHTRAVSHRVEALLQAAVGNARASGVTAGMPVVAEVRQPEGGTAELLTFDLPDGDRLLSWPAGALPEVQCALAWRREEGLVLYYKSRLEEKFADANPRMTVLSGFVTELGYEYYDEDRKSWKREATIQRSGTTLLTPRRLHLRFQRGRQDYTEVITIPFAAEGLPAY